MMVMDKVLYVPGISPEGKFEVVNIKADTPKGYRLYNDSELFDFPLTNENGIQATDIYLSPKNNLCPNCKCKMMDFQVYGEYD